MASQTLPIIFNIIAGFLGAIGQYAYKKGALRLSEQSIFTNYPIAIGMLLFGVVMVLFIVGYKMGGRISIVYPFYATTFIWGALIGYFFEGEPINVSVLGGTLLIVLGLAFIAQGMGKA